MGSRGPLKGKPTGATDAHALKIVLRSTPGEDGCLLWTGSAQPRGYGWICINGRNVTTHRAMWEAHHGPVPPGLVVAHSCDNPRCVEITHLQAMSQAQNLRDKVARGRDQNASKTHCKRGHEFTPENTRTRNNHRQCIACKTSYDAARSTARRSK